MKITRISVSLFGLSALAATSATLNSHATLKSTASYNLFGTDVLAGKKLTIDNSIGDDTGGGKAKDSTNLGETNGGEQQQQQQHQGGGGSSQQQADTSQNAGGEQQQQQAVGSGQQQDGASEKDDVTLAKGAVIDDAAGSQQQQQT